MAADEVAVKAVEVRSIRRCGECPFFCGDGYCDVVIRRVVRPSDIGYEGPPPEWCPLRTGAVVVERSPTMPAPPAAEYLRQRGGDVEGCVTSAAAGITDEKGGAR